ncbi:MAG: hypothetical protein ACE5HY_06680 [Candidatus Hydrothermarchaeales archaeon]
MDRLSEEDMGIKEWDRYYFTISIDPRPERKPRRPKRMMPNN